jgi:DNA-directed RNA polymerase specialized sigma24 family protein
MEQRTAATGPGVQRLLGFGREAYCLAARVLGSHQDAEDAVQQAYLGAFRSPPRGLPSEEARAWFLKVVANSARKDCRSRRRNSRAVEDSGVLDDRGVTARADIAKFLQDVAGQQ